MMGHLYSADYYPVGDLVVVSICVVMIILMLFSYNRKSRSFRIFLATVGALILSANLDVAYHMTMLVDGAPGAGDLLRTLFHAALFGIFMLYVIYIVEVTGLEKSKKRPYLVLSALIYLSVVGMDVTDTLRPGLLPIRRASIFLFGYVAFVGLIFALLMRVRHKLYRRVMWGFYGTIAVSFLMQLIQRLHGQSSFTVASFLYPVLGMFYIMHSSPYDARLGTVDNRALDDMVQYNYNRGIGFVFVSLYMREFDEKRQPLPESVQASVRRFATGRFKGGMLGQIDRGHLVLLFPKRRNLRYEAQLKEMLGDFEGEYKRFKYDYKIVIGESIDEISRNNEYTGFIRGIHHGMRENSIHWVVSDDVVRYHRYKYLLTELQDICDRRDLDDSRVLAYCQPVFNIHTGRYDTAEALMRLRLDELGVLTPDRFISLAEENGQIHVLTQIILYKTCRMIRSLLDAGYEVSRISVNASVLELKGDSFCEDIIDIIDKSGIPGDRVAIELTESRTDSDFNHMKAMIEKLRAYGIKFYLDDFGTGYSNMERIMQLPFDIIKFDRSMVLASEASPRSRQIVLSLASLFDGLNYSVLYEGVEKDSEEEMYVHMSASYLQGFKYSRPVPIEELTRYFTHAA